MFNFKPKTIRKIYTVLFVFIFAIWCIVGGFYLKRCVERAYFYPLKYDEIIYATADKYELDRNYVFALIKIESGFNADAVSNAGAIGLMQITPKTAEYIAKLTGDAEFDLFSPEKNVEYGCFYIRYLLNRFNVTETALAAYNAGEGTVSNWLANREYSDDGINLKNIPYPETREYINKFKKSFEKYNKLYPHILDK